MLNNIYGVDIDPQAVEVTKLSLLLKVLEGETQEVLDRQQKLFHERALPDLATNIKCGNSLLGRTSMGRDRASCSTRRTSSVSTPSTGRPSSRRFAVEDQGFDAVISNPPYVRIQTLAEFSPGQARYLKQRYRSAGTGSFDIYVVFVEKGLALLGSCGKLGFVSVTEVHDHGAGLRSLLAEPAVVREVVDFGHSQVFENATTYTWASSCLTGLA